MVHFTVNVMCREHSVLLEMAPHLYCRGFFSQPERPCRFVLLQSYTEVHKLQIWTKEYRITQMVLSGFGFGDKGIPQWHLL